MKHFLRHCFIPHESNNHRAKILHIDSILIVIALLIFSSFLLSSLQSRFPAVLGISYNIAPNDLLTLTNKIRQERGLSPFALDPQLSQAASNKATDMLAKNYWAHIAPDGTTPWVFIKNSGYDYLYAGENLARGFSNASDVVSAWMASPTHRDNMLSPNYSDIGFAVETGTLTGSDTVLVVEMFGSRYRQAKAAITSNPALNQLAPSSAVGILVRISATPIPPPAMQKRMEGERIEVAAIQQQPLVDRNDFEKKIVVSLIVIFITILTVDAIIIERKKIVRLVSHNLDHIIYLAIILLIIIIIGGGAVL